MTKNSTINLTRNFGRQKRPPFNKPTTMRNRITASSIAESTDPTLKPAWSNQGDSKLPKQWPRILLISFSTMIVVLIIVLIVNIATRPNSKSPEEETIDPDVISDENPLDEEADLNSFFASIAADPDFNYEFTATETLYSNIPSRFSCDDLKEVATMNAEMLKYYLDNGSVVVLSGKWNNPSDEATGKAIMIYGGSLVDSIYNTAQISCPKSPDQNLSRTNTSSSVYASYSGSDIFNNLIDEKHYYIWTDPTNIGGK